MTRRREPSTLGVRLRATFRERDHELVLSCNCSLQRLYDRDIGAPLLDS